MSISYAFRRRAVTGAQVYVHPNKIKFQRVARWLCGRKAVSSAHRLLDGYGSYRPRYRLAPEALIVWSKKSIRELNDSENIPAISKLWQRPLGF